MAVSKSQNASIAFNKKARFDYFIEDEYEAGLVLEGLGKLKVYVLGD